VANENIVKILVTGDNAVQPTFDEVNAGAEEMAEKVSAAADESAAAMEREADAQAELAEASGRLAEVQGDSSASADELATAQDAYSAALDRSTTATLAALDAQARLGEAELAASDSAKVAGDAQEDAGVKSDASAGMFAGAGGKMKMAALGVAVGLGLAVKGAADFQQQTTRLVTSAGESARNLGMVQRGILALSSATDTSTSQLASGMYMVESAGFHGAAGLTVLKAAAEGAQAEGANLADVANAVTSGLNAYGLKAKDATAFTDMMKTAVGQGKMTMQDFASSLSAVLPKAAAAHISFQQVAGAVATMTGMGMSARQATQDLAATIHSLVQPSGVAGQEMRAMGLSALQVEKNVGRQGLTGTLAELSDAVLKNTHGGSVMLGYMQKMTPAAQGLARQILAGSISTKQLRNAVYDLNPEQAKLISLFETASTSATGLKQTYAGAMSTMLGGSTGLNTALMLTGTHAKTFADNVKAIGGAAKGAGSNVKGWSLIQGQANFQLGSAVKAIEAMGISLGMALLPSVTAVLKPITSFLGLIARNKAAAIAFAAILGGVLAGALGAKLAMAAKDAKEGLSLLFDAIGNAPSAISSMASGFASAASSVASFAAQTVSQLGRAIAATAVWIAEHAVATAQFIAQNVAQAASATAAFVAENLATLGIIAGIALLIAGIVLLATHWKEVWGVIKKVALDAWHFLDSELIHPMMQGVADVVSWVRAHFDLLAEIIGTVLLGPVGFLIAWIATHWAEFRSLTSKLIDDVVHFFETLPGRIMSAIASLPSLLFHAGAHIISMLASGITSAIGDVTHAIGSVASEIVDHLPFSPAKKGPLSGSGDPELRGRHVAELFGAGMVSGLPSVSAAAARLAGTAGIGPGGMRGYGAAGAGGEIRVVIDITGGDSELTTWLKNRIRVLGGGGPNSVQKALGRVP
jgi:TP901 family phage tail tape measure protein